MSRAGKGVFTAHTMVQGSLEELGAGAAELATWVFIRGEAES